MAIYRSTKLRLRYVSKIPMLAETGAGMPMSREGNQQQQSSTT
jgi:hypothetical protein